MRPLHEAHLTYPGVLLRISKGVLNIFGSEVKLLDAANVILWMVDMAIVRAGPGSMQRGDDYKSV